MNRLQFYFSHSLMGYFCRRAKEKWFTRLPSELNYHGILLRLDDLPEGMQMIIRAGHYETPEMKLASTLLSSSDRVLEIGSAIGFIGLFCLKVLKVRSLVSVEPNPNTLSKLKRNYELNGLRPNLIEAAIAPVDGPVSFHVNDMFWVDSLVTDKRSNNVTQISVQGLTFNTILERAGETIDTLIMDVEGAEKYLPVNSIPHQIKKIIIEIHNDILGDRPAYNILETLVRAGYNVHGQSYGCWAFVRD